MWSRPLLNSSTNGAWRAVNSNIEKGKNRILTSPDIVASPCNKKNTSLLRISQLEAPTPLDRADFSGDLTDFSSKNRAFRVVKGTEEGNELNVDFTQHFCKSPDATNTVHHRVEVTIIIGRERSFFTGRISGDTSSVS
jgi:hypothetical protein